MFNKIFLAFAFFFITVALAAQQKRDTLFKRPVIVAAMKKVADWQIKEFDEGRNKYNKAGWENSALYTGIVELLKLTREERYYRFLYNIGEGNNWNTGRRRFHADDLCVGQMYAEMYRLYKQPVMIEKFKLLADSIVAKEFTESLEWKNEINMREWAWCDALYMAPPALGYLSTATGNGKYLEKADELWWKTTGYLYDKDEKLYYRDSRYFDKKEANGNKVFWSRGNGWVMGGLVRMMENMPVNYPNRKKFEALFKEMSQKIASLQHEDGSWHASLLDSVTYKSKETSGTGFFCYALTWGIRNDLLPRAKYLPVVQKAWAALMSSIHPDGKLGFVQAIGDRPDKVDYESTNVYGIGAFLLAGTELYKLQGTAKSPTDAAWTNKNAAKWVKTKTWANGLQLTIHPSVDKVEFARQYHNNQAAWDQAFTFIKEHNLEDIAPGKYPIDSTNVFASVTEAPSKEFEKTGWESHRKYIDLQYVIKGKEKIGVASASKAAVLKTYDEKSDLQNYTTSGKYYIAQPGTFFLFFPENAHRPSVKVDGYDMVKKLVIKIKVAD